MVGNVNHIVESMHAADNIRNQQSAANAKNGNFSNYLESALLNYRTGILTGGFNSGYSCLNALSGSSWQTVVLEALRDELKKKQTEEKKDDSQKDEETSALAQAKKKPDWAKIRVIERYKSPKDELSEKTGVLV